MEYFEVVEYGIVALIVLIQLGLFFNTQKKISIFRSIIPNEGSFSIVNLHIPTYDLEHTSPEEILSNGEKYLTPPERYTSGLVKINIVIANGKTNAILDKILTSINTYFLKNREGVTDFSLIKDIVERNTDAVEEDINLTISIPLYLGLMGTMLGIVIGLFSMSGLSQSITGQLANDALGNGISTLLGGVKIAMIASFVGLLLTIINSGWYYKGSKSALQTNKNNFYTFIQTRLLPTVNQSLPSTINSLQKNLAAFNLEFLHNLTKLSGVYEKNTQSIDSHAQVMEAINNTDLSTIAKYNIDVFNGIKGSVKSLEKFNTYLTQLNSFVDTSKSLVDSSNELLTRTDDFKNIASHIDNTLTTSNDVLTFLKAFFKDIEEKNNSFKEVTISVDNTITKSLQDLEKHTQTSIENLRKLITEQAEFQQQAVKQHKDGFGNLAYLKEINDSLKEIKGGFRSSKRTISKTTEPENKGEVKEKEKLGKKITKNTQKVKNWFKRKFSRLS